MHPNIFHFPFSFFHLQVAVYPSEKNPTPIAELVTKLSLKPHSTEVFMGRTTNNTYRIEWHNAHPNRDANQTADASIELFRNGNVIVSENGVETEIPYDIPFEHDGFGQDEDWVRANFANVEEIISIGYANWVDQQVGVGLTNGLYKFTALFEDDPPEPTQFYIGDYSVCVTNAAPQVHLKLDAPEGLALNGERRLLTANFKSDISTNGCVVVRCINGNDKVSLWSALTNGVSVASSNSWNVASTNSFSCYVQGTALSDYQGVEFECTYVPENGSNQVVRAKSTVFEGYTQPVSNTLSA